MIAKAVILYDGKCPLCQRSIALLKRLDWGNHFTYCDARQPAQWPRTRFELRQDQLLEQMHVVTPDRRKAYAGFAAFRWIAARVPLCWPIVPLLYFPGIPRLGHKLYRWIAENRFRLVPCHDGSCTIPMKRT